MDEAQDDVKTRTRLPAPDANGEAEVKQRSHRATLFSPSILANLEKLAQEIKCEYPAVCVRLKTLAPKVEQLRQAFHEAPRGTLMVMGCKSFGEFCRKQLGYSESQVYRTLAGYAKPEREKLPPKKLPAKELALSKHDKQRVLDVAAGMVQYFEADEKGDKEAMLRYKNDVMFIAKAQPLRSAVFENYDVRNEVLQLKRRLHRLATAALAVVTAVENADDQTLPADLVAAASGLRQELFDVDTVRLENAAPANEPEQDGGLPRLPAQGDGSPTEMGCGDRISDDASASQSLLQKYGPRHINDFLGLQEPRQLMTALAMTPIKSEYLFVGPPGVGKSSLALTLSADMGAELHHLPAKDCDLQKVKDLLFALQYVPQRGGRSAPAHIVVVDEADEMSWGAQTAFLSLLDETADQAGSAGSLVHAGLPNITIFIFTANNPAKLEERFRSRCQPVEFDTDGIVPTELEQRLREIWLLESGGLAGAPDFAAIVRECKCNVRCAFKRLERELMLAAGAQQRRFPKVPEQLTGTKEVRELDDAGNAGEEVA